MDMRQLKYFDAIVRHRNFTKAAKELFLSQPSLSNQMKLLEQEFGYPLFEKDTKQFALTDAGKILFENSREILHQFDILCKQMKQLKEIGSGEISLGTLGSSKYWGKKIITEFREKYPSVRVIIQDKGAHEMEEALLSHKFHIAFTYKMLDSELLEYFCVGNVEYVLLVSSSHRLASCPKVRFSEITQEKFVMSSQEYAIQKIFSQYSHKSNFEPVILYESNNIDTVVDLVASGMAVSLIPRNFSHNFENHGVKSIALTEPVPTVPLYIAYHKKRTVPESVRCFLAILREHSCKIYS